MLVDAVDFLNANDQNEVRLPIVKYLASQRASSMQTLVTYFIAVRLVLMFWSIGSPFSTAGRWITSRNQMRSRLPRVGSCLGKPACLLLWIAE
jgi:hypothetical protein